MFNLLIIFVLITKQIKCIDENVLLTEVFTIQLDPSLFNWTYEGNPYQYTYEASLLNSPDLPSWINYIFSEKHHKGYLYGVPPKRNNTKISLNVLACNEKNYHIRSNIINIYISEKLNPAKYEVMLKIDNLNVDDMFDVDRMDNLRDIFKKKLWKNSENDLYVTYLESATDLGARKPLNPEQGEGVVLKLGSQSEFSNELKQLEEEVRPLLKVQSCPRDFKRTSVERYFRDAGFALDWCGFKLIDQNIPIINFKSKQIFNDNKWETIDKFDVPRRNYDSDIIWSLVIPIAILFTLTLLLSFIMCFYHENIYDQASEDFFNNLFHICTDMYERYKDDDFIENKKIDTVGPIINKYNTDVLKLSPDPMLFSSRSHTNSPTSTINRGLHCRPSPPPYVRPRFKQEEDDDNEENKNWYC